MMTLYSGTTCPFSHRCRIVLFEKGMDFQVIDVDLTNKPEDLAVINPYNRVPVLVERDLVLYEANIINEYIDERFPHPQLMPADPVMRARARLFLHNFEDQLSIILATSSLETPRWREKAPRDGARQPDPDCPHLPNKQEYMLGMSSPCLTWRSPRCCGGWSITASSCRNRLRRCSSMPSAFSPARRISRP